MKTIASRDNAAYKALAKLASSAAERRRRGLTVIEGAHLVQACLDAGHAVMYEKPAEFIALVLGFLVGKTNIKLV